MRPDLPYLGTALPVLLFRLPLPVALPLVGAWIRMRNVSACVVAGQLQVCSFGLARTCLTDAPFPFCCAAATV